MKDLILNYFNIIDESIDKLSEQNEGSIIGLPSWIHTSKKIIIGLTNNEEGVVIKVIPDEKIENDIINIVKISSENDINNIISPMIYNGGPLEKEDENFFLLIGDIMLVETANPLAIPILNNQCLIGIGRKKAFINTFSEIKAKEEALDLWNKRLLSNNSNDKVYIIEVKKILDRLQSIIKRKAYLERRVHRFINEYKNILLPQYRQCLYEHHIKYKNELRKADFILEREKGIPPILIELESPVHKVFTNKFEFTAQVNHARNQISEWVKFIDSDPLTNASGELEFLSGKKERLIVIGRGLEHKSRLIDTKHDETKVWTYEMFIEEAKYRLNEQYAAQCKMLNIKVHRPF